MVSPFPGVDPYLEDPAFWQDFHRRFITYCADALVELLPDQYEARIDEQVRLIDVTEGPGRALPDVAVLHDPSVPARPAPAPASAAVATLEPVTVPMAVTAEVRDVWVEVLHRPERSLVTVIELLSPSNKSGAGLGEYLAKRRSVLNRGANLVELDLLVGGQRMPLLRAPPRADYYAFVIRHHRLPNVDVYAWTVRQPLPNVPVPLRPGDREVVLDLPTLMFQAYQRGGYARSLRYEGPPRAPLQAEDLAWAEHQVAQVRRQRSPS